MDTTPHYLTIKALRNLKSPLLQGVQDRLQLRGPHVAALYYECQEPIAQ